MNSPFRHFLRKACLFAGLSVVATAPALADDRALVDAAGLSRGEVAFLAQDLSGASCSAWRADAPMPPASVAKVPTALVALERLGADYRFETRLDVYGGLAADGLLVGDVVLRGGGDPVLTEEHLRDMVATLASAGVRRISGMFAVDPGPLPDLPAIEPSQPGHVAYNPPVSGLTVDFNRQLLTWRRAGDRGPLVAGFSPDLGLDGAVITRTRGPYGEPVWNAHAGSVPGVHPGRRTWNLVLETASPGSIWVPASSPPLRAALLMRTAAESQGIELPEPVLTRVEPGEPAGSIVHSSMPLVEIAEQSLRFSNNLVAELLGLAAAGDPAPRGLGDAAAITGDWLAGNVPGFDAEGFHLENHSGLSLDSRMSPQQTVALLRQGAGRRYGDQTFLDLLREPRPRAATQDLPFRAKSGTMHHVRGLAGVLETARGRSVLFAIFAFDPEGRARLDTHPQRYGGGAVGPARAWLAKARKLEDSLLARWHARC